MTREFQHPFTSEISSSRYCADGGFRHRTAPDWEDIFPFESTYDAQHEGIKQALSIGRDNGYLVLEGACGTGKSLLALTAGLTPSYDEKPEENTDIQSSISCGDSGVDGELIFTHSSEENIDASQIEIEGSDASGAPIGWHDCDATISSIGTVSLGNQAKVEATPDSTVRVVWTDEAGETSTVLRE